MTSEQTRLSRIDHVSQEICSALKHLEAYFSPGLELTFLARDTSGDNGHLIVTGDDLGEVIKAVDYINKSGNVKVIP